jgi:TPR repeat protein
MGNSNKLFYVVLISLFLSYLNAQNYEPQKPQPYSEDIVKKAEVGDSGAQAMLASFYFSGSGVERNVEKAFAWSEKSAGQNNPEGLVLYGILLMEGIGTQKNEGKGFEQIKKAAELNYVTAQVTLGNCLFNGTGVTKDYVGAVKWFEKTAQTGNPQGQAMLGLCYAYGFGIEKNESKAMAWYRKAAEKGDPMASEELRRIEKNAVSR